MAFEEFATIKDQNEFDTKMKGYYDKKLDNDQFTSLDSFQFLLNNFAKNDNINKKDKKKLD